jgi:hypothetical protein
LQIHMNFDMIIYRQQPRSFDADGRVAGSQGLRWEDAVYGNDVTVR